MDFLQGIKAIQNPAILLKQNEQGLYEAVFVSKSYADLMECTQEEAYAFTAGEGFLLSTYQDDRPSILSILKNKQYQDGKSFIAIRKTTAKGKQIWCNVQYSFIDDDTNHYVYCTYFDVTLIKEYEKRLNGTYMNLGKTVYKANERTLGMFRINLSRNIIEDMQGKDLFNTDSLALPYSVVMQARSKNYPIKAEQELFLSKFSKENIIAEYLAGRNQIEAVLYSCRSDGHYCFVNIKASITQQPITGDIVTFLSEEESNTQKINQILIDNILVRQFDMVSYLVDETYDVIIGDATHIGEGNIFPNEKKGNYNHYLNQQVIPALHGSEEEKKQQANSLQLNIIEENLKAHSPYVANIAVDVAGETYYKRFDFYKASPDTNFYIILKSDTTDIQKKQISINEQLAVALKEAQQASIAKTTFLSQMSHEIRTPMNAIIGLDNIALQEENLSPHIRGYLEKIGGSARHLLSLINDILDMSRIESGRMILKKEEFAFSTVLDQVNTIIDGQCKDKGLHYDCIIHGSIDEYYIGDDTKLRQVLINVLGNSVKFTEKGGSVSLSVERIAEFEKQSTIRFILKDNGIGMDKDFLPKIFDAFSQENSTSTNKYGGSGLGLAITKNIIEMMNGSIKVESEKGKGTTFIIDITLQNTGRKGEVRKYDVHPQDLHTVIIDDDPIACKYAHLALEEIGIESDTCLSGKEALEMIKLSHARRNEYNLILVDLKMPEQDGVEVTRQIRKLLGNDATIVILTAYSWAEVEDEASKAGVDAFMSKPIFAS